VLNCALKAFYLFRIKLVTIRIGFLHEDGRTIRFVTPNDRTRMRAASNFSVHSARPEKVWSDSIRPLFLGGGGGVCRVLALFLLTGGIWWAANNASRWQSNAFVFQYFGHIIKWPNIRLTAAQYTERFFVGNINTLIDTTVPRTGPRYSATEGANYKKLN